MIIEIYLLTLLFLLGTCLGSFIYVICIRADTGEEFIHSRSRCDSCKHILHTFDLLPLVSFLLLKGKCRYCKASIPAGHFIAEAVLGVLFFLVGLSVLPYLNLTQSNTLFAADLLLKILTIAFFFYMAVYDFLYYTIEALPVYIFIGGLSLILIGIDILHYFHRSPFFYQDYTAFLFNHFGSALISFLFFFGLYKLTKERGIGGGDVQISFLIGLLLGGKASIIAFYVAFLVGAVISVGLLLWKKRKMNDAIPFGPFLAIGVIVSILYSSQILQWKIFDFLNIVTLLIKT